MEKQVIKEQVSSQEETHDQVKKQVSLLGNTHGKSGFHLSGDSIKGAGFILSETHVKEWVSSQWRPE